MSENVTSILAETDPRDPLKNRYRVHVVGALGAFHGVRRTLTEARATARHYARLLDAPHSAI
jgi:hypothetical protein